MGATGGETAESGEDLSARLEGAGSVLLLAPEGERSDEVCADLVTPATSGRERLLSVTFTRSVDERIESWRRHTGHRQPRQTSIVTVGDTARSVAAGGDDTLQPTPGITVETVADPANLSEIGLAINDRLAAWEGTDTPIVVCFASLTPLLEATAPEEVFRFLHVLCSRIDAVDAFAHFHLDPDAVDDRAVRTLEPLFDARVERSETGGWTVTWI